SPVEAGQLATVFAAPRWLRDLGRTSWLLVGLFLLLAGVVWLLGTTQTIVGPVIAGTIVAAVTAPVVRRVAARPCSRAPPRGCRSAAGRRCGRRSDRDRDRRGHVADLRDRQACERGRRQGRGLAEEPR